MRRPLRPLVLDGGYVPGSPFGNREFVSFTYDGTDLIPGGFTIGGFGVSVSGTLPAAPGFASVDIFDRIWEFTSDTDGNWQVCSGGCNVNVYPQLDVGTGGTFSSATPEPATALLAGIGALGAFGVRLVKRRRAA